MAHAHGEPGRQLPAQATEGEPAFEPPEKKGNQHKNKQLQVEQSKMQPTTAKSSMNQPEASRQGEHAEVQGVAQQQEQMQWHGQTGPEGQNQRGLEQGENQLKLPGKVKHISQHKFKGI